MLYGGCRGPGKSYWLRRIIPKKLIEWGQKYNLQNINAMLACETYTALQDRQLNPMEREMPEWLGVLKSSQIDGLHFQIHDYLGGHKILMRNIDDPNKYKSGEFAIIGVDQTEQIPEDHYWILRGSNRWSGLPRAKFIGTGNPLGVGHAWNVNYFLDHIYPEYMEPEQRTQYRFIAATPYDNRFLSQSYWDFLNSLPPRLKRAWLYGDYHVFSGQAFPTFTYDSHVIKWIDFTDEWKAWPSKWRAVDWGFKDPYTCGWFTKNPSNGRIYVYRNTWQTDLNDRQQAIQIKDNTPPDELINITYADPSMWSKKNRGGDESTLVTSAADEYAIAGVPIVAAENNRLNGLRKFRNLLDPLADGKPGIIFLETCYNLWRTIPLLVLEENGEDIMHDKNHKQEDHGYDMIRYGLTNELGQATPKYTKSEPSPLERLMNQRR